MLGTQLPWVKHTGVRVTENALKCGVAQNSSYLTKVEIDLFLIALPAKDE